MNVKSTLLIILTIGIGLTGIAPQSFADHTTAEVSLPVGSAVPGCEETNACYIPEDVTVDVGGEVTWSNDDNAAHTVTSGTPAEGPDGAFDSSLFMAGATFSHTFDTEGVYPYFCMVHPWMVGTVTVEGAAAEEQADEGMEMDMSVPSEASIQEKLEFGAGLEETLGHFWALEQNLDENNAELSLIHATHPISELYDAMKPQLKSADPALDDKVKTTLLELKDKATITVSRSQAQSAIDDAKELVEIARSAIIGDELSNDPIFKAKLMKTLLETSIAEYGEAVEDGVIGEMAEFQDGSAFVWRSQVIFEEIKSDLPEHEALEIEELFADVKSAYDSRADLSQVDTLTGGIIHEIDEITGEESGETEPEVYVETIRQLLTQAKQEYANGDKDLALSLATKAYLDNFEFLEGPLVEAGEKELMVEVEIMMREELRSMIKNGASVSDVNSQIDTILIKMDAVEVAVPEFGSIAMLILVTAIVGSVLFASRSKLLSINPRI